MLVVTDMYNRANTAFDGADLRSAAQDLYDAAQDELDEAQDAYDDLMYEDGAQQIITARADLAVAEERYQSARDLLLAVESGINAANLAGSESALRKAELSTEQARLAVESGGSQPGADRHPDLQVDHHRPVRWGHPDLDRQGG